MMNVCGTTNRIDMIPASSPDYGRYHAVLSLPDRTILLGPRLAELTEEQRTEVGLRLAGLDAAAGNALNGALPHIDQDAVVENATANAESILNGVEREPIPRQTRSLGT
jgi:hypothetical protein